MNGELLLSVSVNLVLETFGTLEGILVIDDTGKKRSKVTKNIPYIPYFKDKDGTGCIKGPEIVLLVLVTPLVTIPVALEFYQPDPADTPWAKLEKRLKKQGVAKHQRPPQPAINPNYPTKQQIALHLLKQLASSHPQVTVTTILADALYGNVDFRQTAAELFENTQIISQLRHNQKIHYRGRIWHLDEYFKAYPGVTQTIKVRGGKETQIIVSSARLYVEAQQRKCLVVALRYPDETDYRYLVASDLSWRTVDIVPAYTNRWLIEVTIEDLKIYEGWGQATKQPGIEGSRRGLTLSLLCDHCLLLHPEQQARVELQEPLYTIGSLQRHLSMESFIAWLERWSNQEGFTA